MSHGTTHGLVARADNEIFNSKVKFITEAAGVRTDNAPLRCCHFIFQLITILQLCCNCGKEEKISHYVSVWLKDSFYSRRWMFSLLWTLSILTIFFSKAAFVYIFFFTCMESLSFLYVYMYEGKQIQNAVSIRQLCMLASLLICIIRESKNKRGKSTGQLELEQKKK